MGGIGIGIGIGIGTVYCAPPPVRLCGNPGPGDDRSTEMVIRITPNEEASDRDGVVDDNNT